MIAYDDLNLSLALRGQPKQASLTLACEGRWRMLDAGVEEGARIGFYCADVFWTLALRKGTRTWRF